MPTDDPEEDADDDRRTSEEVAGDVIMLVTGSQDPTQNCKRKQVRWTDGEDEMRGQLEEYGASHHVTEIYSPPRVTTWAANMRLIPGLAMDLTCVDPDDGNPWDFNDEDKVRKARVLIHTPNPLLLIGSPTCSAFSQMNNINFSRMSKNGVEDVVAHGRRHLQV